MGVLARQRKTIQAVVSRKAWDRAASQSALPLPLQAMPSVLVDPNPNQDVSPAVMDQLVAAEQMKRDIQESNNKVRLEMDALQVITDKKKILD